MSKPLGLGGDRGAAWMREARATLALALPLILTNLAGTGLATADVMLLGRVGPEAVAAGALGTNLYFALAFTGMGLVSAATPLMAEAAGRRSHSVRDIRRTVRQGLWSSILIALPVWLFLWHGEAFLRLIGQAPALAVEAGAYLRTLEWGILPLLGFAVLRAYLAALERPGWALAIGLGAVPVNVGLAAWLIWGGLAVPPLGLIGAGIATSITSLLMFVALAAIVVTDRRFRRFRLFGRFWRPDWPRLGRLWRLGLPIAGTLAFEVLLFNSAAFAVGTFGAVPLAAHAVALQVASMAFMVPLGIGQAATVRVGLAYGAGDRPAIRIAGGCALACGVAFAAVTAAAIFAAPQAIVSAFLSDREAEGAAAVGLAIRFLMFAAVFQLADSMQAVASGMLRGLQDTRIPLLLVGVGYWLIGAPVGLWLGFMTDLRGQGIWTGLSLGLASVAALLLVRWFALVRRPLRGAPRPVDQALPQAWTAV